MPLISIITINYNNRPGLARTIASVLEQSATDFEFVVIDGGSTDGSVEVIKQYSSGINYWVSEPDKGIYSAMNKGIKMASGKYCLFLNSGDYLRDNGVLKKVVDEGLDKDIVYGNMIIDWGNGKRTEGVMPDKVTFEHMIQDTIWHPVSFIKRNLFQKFGNYREDLSIVSDYEFFLKALVVNKVSYKHIPVTVSVFLVDGMSSDPKNVALQKLERRKVQLEHFAETSINAVPAVKQQRQTILNKLIRKLTGGK